MDLHEWEMVWICILIFSVEVEMNGQEKKEIQQEEMAIRQMFIGLNMKREVGQDFSNVSLHISSCKIDLRNIHICRNVLKVGMKQKMRYSFLLWRKSKPPSLTENKKCNMRLKDVFLIDVCAK